MKRLLFITTTILPLFAYADIIVTRSNGNIEDVTVISVTADNVIYKQDSNQKTIATSEVEGVLYDDGRYITPPSKQTIPADDEVTSSNDSWAIDDALQESQNNAQQTNTQANNNVVIEFLFWDESYSKECREEGSRIFSEISYAELKKIKQTRKTMTKEEQKAAKEAAAFKALKAGNDAVLECSGLKDNNTHTQPDNESGQ